MGSNGFFLSSPCKNLLHTPTEILKGGVCLHPQRDYFGRFWLFFSTAQKAACCWDCSIHVCNLLFCGFKTPKRWAQNTENQPYFGTKMIYQQPFGKSSAEFGVSIRGRRRNAASSPRVKILAWKIIRFFWALACFLSFCFLMLCPRGMPRVILEMKLHFWPRV